MIEFRDEVCRSCGMQRVWPSGVCKNCGYLNRSLAVESFARASRAVKEMIDEDNADVRVVRHVDRPVLGSQETNFVPLPITDDRDFDYVDPRLKEDADLVIQVTYQERKEL